MHVSAEMGSYVMVIARYSMCISAEMGSYVMVLLPEFCPCYVEKQC